MKKRNNWWRVALGLLLIIGLIYFGLSEAGSGFLIGTGFFMAGILVWGYTSALLSKAGFFYSGGVTFLGNNDMKNFRLGETSKFWMAELGKEELISLDGLHVYKTESEEGKNEKRSWGFRHRLRIFIYSFTGLVFYGIPFLWNEDPHRLQWGELNPAGKTFDTIIRERDEVTTKTKKVFTYLFSFNEIDQADRKISKQIWALGVVSNSPQKQRYESDPSFTARLYATALAHIRAFNGSRTYDDMVALKEVGKDKDLGSTEKFEYTNRMLELKQKMIGGDTMVVKKLKVNTPQKDTYEDSDYDEIPVSVDGIHMNGMDMTTLDLLAIDYDYEKAQVAEIKGAPIKVMVAEESKKATIIEVDAKLYAKQKEAEGNKAVNDVEIELQQNLKTIRVEEQGEKYAIWTKNKESIKVKGLEAVENTKIKVLSTDKEGLKLLIDPDKTDSQ